MPQPSSFTSRLNFTPEFLPRPFTGDRKWGMHLVRILPHALSLLQPVVPPMGDNSARNPPTQVLSIGCVVLHELFQNVSCPTECSLSGRDVSRMGLPCVHRSCQNISSGMGSSPWRHSPARTCSRGGFPRGHIFLNHTSICCGFGSSTGWISALPRTFIGCGETTSRTMVFITGCRNISALVLGAAPLPPSSLTFLTAELFLSQNPTRLFLLILHNCFSALSISGSTDAVLDRK